MKLYKQKNGTLNIVTNSPLLIYNNINNSRIACELDEARLFLLTTKNSRKGAVQTEVRLHAIEDDRDLARKRELEYLLIPARHLRNEPEINEVYIGRYRVARVSSLVSMGGNTLSETQTEMVPAPMPRFDWDASGDGQEMLELAANASIDQRKLAVAASACARLTIHLTRNMPEPRLALEAVEKWSQSNVGRDEMEQAISDNHSGRLCELHQRDEAFHYAADAALCDPLNVVTNGANAFAAAFKDMAPEMDYDSVENCQNHIQKLMRAACANIIRKTIRIADYPALAMLVEQRNETLCRAPSYDLSQWGTEVANQL
jgi:hypothetical protein